MKCGIAAELSFSENPSDISKQDEPMPQTNLYRKQHSEIIKIIEEMAPFLDFNVVSENPVSTHSLFLKLSEKLSPHLAMEAKNLYPFLYIHQNNQVRIHAINFYYKHKELMKDLEEYNIKWDNPDSVQKRPFEFIKDCSTLCDNLRKRFYKENNELFPLIEK